MGYPNFRNTPYVCCVQGHAAWKNWQLPYGFPRLQGPSRKDCSPSLAVEYDLTWFDNPSEVKAPHILPISNEWTWIGSFTLNPFKAIGFWLVSQNQRFPHKLIDQSPHFWMVPLKMAGFPHGSAASRHSGSRAQSVCWPIGSSVPTHPPGTGPKDLPGASDM